MQEGHAAVEAFVMDGTPAEIVRRYAQLPALAEALSFGELDENIVVLDTETTGVSYNHDELTQIAAARMEKGRVTDTFSTFVNPGRPIPDDVAHLTNIHDEDVADAPGPEEALALLVDFVGDAKVVAHNAGFDKFFTTRHPAGYPLLENLWIDSLDLARIALPRMKSHRLIDLVRAFGAPLSTHRADEDVAATCALFRILLAAVHSMPAPLVKAIADMASPELWSTSAVFALLAADAEAAEGEREAAPLSLRQMRMSRLDASAQRGAAGDPPADGRMPEAEAELVFPTQAEIEEFFSPSGALAALNERYEPRPEQLAMANAVAAAYAGSNRLVVEAGTGVGKSMAYLLPSALVALRNPAAVGVATKTNALLDQLMHHELPALADALDATGAFERRLSFAALKGYTHYPCLRKVERLLKEGPKTREVTGVELPQAPALAAILSFVEQTAYDDMDGLKTDYRVLPRSFVTTTGNECLKRKCPFYGAACFVHGARRNAQASDIVVTNHSLFFCDLASGGALLPPAGFWVVDEAHGAEAEARRAFSLALSTDKLKALASRVSAKEASRNVFSHVERVVLDPESLAGGATLLFALTAKAKSAGEGFAEAAAAFGSQLRELLFFDPSGKRGRGYDRVDLWVNDEICASERFARLAAAARGLIDAAEKLTGSCRDLVALLEDARGAALVQREIAAMAMDLKEAIHAAEVIFVSGSDAYLRAASLSRKADRGEDRIEALLYNVGEALGETLYENTRSVVFASATLAVGESFDSFTTAMGLGAGERSGCSCLRLGSSYDFDRQMTVYVVKDMPEPNDAHYLAELERLLALVHKAQNGSMLTLFTNRREMEECFSAVQPELREQGLRLVCQKWGTSAKGLRDDFIADKSLSLFALKSFWEGFDAPGSTLRGVVIPKLPFAKPTDPLSCERAARDDQAWRRYVLPAAVLETKQAAGRLIRRADDEGVLILADKRLLTKSYGKTFLRSLPSRDVRVLPMARIAEELAGRI